MSIQGAIRLLAEADRLADYEKLFRRLNERCWSKIGIANELLDEFRKTESKELAEKVTEIFKETFELSWLMAETAIKAGAHAALGMTADEYWEHLTSPLREMDGEDSDIGEGLYRALQEWRASDLPYDAIAKNALAEAA